MCADRPAWTPAGARRWTWPVMVAATLAVAARCPADPAQQVSSAPSDLRQPVTAAQPITRQSIQDALQAGPQARQAMIDHLAGLLGDSSANQIHFNGGADPVYLHLTKFGRHAVPALKAVYAKGSKAARLEALQALGHMHDPSLRSFFLAETANDDPDLARVASWALIYVADESLADHFVEQLRSARSTRVRGYAALAVGDLAGRKHLRFFHRAIRDDDPAVVREALRVIGQVGDPSSAEAVLRRIEGQPLSTHWLPYAASALVQVGRREQGLKLLREGLDGEAGNWMVYATELGRTGDKDAWALLVEAMSRPANRPAERCKWLLEALGQTGDRRALAVLVAELGRIAEQDVVAVRAIEQITGLAFGLRYDTPEPQRDRILADVRRWWRRWSRARVADGQTARPEAAVPTTRPAQ